MKDSVTNAELYKAIMGVQTEVSGKIDTLHTRMNNVIENRITPLEVWRANITGQFAIITIAIGLGINLAFDWVKEKFKA